MTINEISAYDKIKTRVDSWSSVQGYNFVVRVDGEWLTGIRKNGYWNVVTCIVDCGQMRLSYMSWTISVIWSSKCYWNCWQKELSEHGLVVKLHKMIFLRRSVFSWWDDTVSYTASNDGHVKSIPGKQTKKLIRRWDSERELSLRLHSTRTKNTIDSCINYATDRFLQRRFTNFSEITQCNGHYVV